MTQKQISGTLKTEPVQESYGKWSEEVQNDIEEEEKTFRQNPRKDIMELKRKRKKLRTQYKNTENVYKKTIIIEKTHKGRHNRQNEKNRSRRIINVGEKIK